MAGHPYLAPLEAAFIATADPAKAAPMEAYMKGKFTYFGIKSPDRKALAKTFLKESGYPPNEELEAIVKDLYSRPEREYHSFAEETVRHLVKKKIAGPEILPLLEYMVVTNSWWDTIDMIAMHSVATIFKRFPELISPHVDRWMASGNFWLQRICILFQNRYKSDTDSELLFRLCDELAEESEFFLRKAIGWALRDYSKTDPMAVFYFVQQHEQRLSPLSKREALRKISPEDIKK